MTSLRRVRRAVISIVFLSSASVVLAEDVTLIAPGGMRCAIDRIAPRFEATTGHKLKATIGAGGAVRERVVSGEPFDVPIVQPPLDGVVASGHVVASSETPLARVPLVVVVKKGAPRPDISGPDAFKRALVAARFVSYPDGRGGKGGAAGVSFDETQKQLGIFAEVQPKVKRVQGVSLMRLVTTGEIDFAVTFASEVHDPDVEVVGELPRQISTPTALVAFVSADTRAPDAARSLLSYLSSPDAAAAYRACGMHPGR